MEESVAEGAGSLAWVAVPVVSGLFALAGAWVGSYLSAARQTSRDRRLQEAEHKRELRKLYAGWVSAIQEALRSEGITSSFTERHAKTGSAGSREGAKEFARTMFTASQRADQLCNEINLLENEDLYLDAVNGIHQRFCEVESSKDREDSVQRVLGGIATLVGEMRKAGHLRVTE